MIIGRARLKTIVAGQFGLNWYAIDRRCVRRGQGEIAEQAVAFRRKGFGGCSASERSAYQPGRSSARAGLFSAAKDSASGPEAAMPATRNPDSPRTSSM